jgi:DNA-binding HxlR family transcriptional regulator
VPAKRWSTDPRAEQVGRDHPIGSDSIQERDATYSARVSRAVELLEGKWTIQILCVMRAHPVRLSELKREIPLASKKGLTTSLRSLEAARIILRRDLSHSVLHVEYEIVDAMRQPLVMLLDQLAVWGNLHDLEVRSMKPVSTSELK